MTHPVCIYPFVLFDDVKSLSVL